MKELIEEYGTAVLALLGAAGLFAALRTPLFSAGGSLGQLIELWVKGAC